MKQTNIAMSVDSVTNSVWSCSSDGNTALASERDSPSDRQPRLSWLVVEVVRLGWRRSVGLTPVSLRSPLCNMSQKISPTSMTLFLSLLDRIYTIIVLIMYF